MGTNPLTTTTSELRSFVDGRRNVEITMMVAEVCEPRTFPPKQDGRKPVRLMAVRLINDEEEPVKLLVWGDQIPDMRNSLKQGALYRISGLDVRAVYNARYGFGHLGVEFTFRPEGHVDMVRPVYQLRGLTLVHEGDVDPRTSWRIRVRAVVERQFSRYYHGDTGLSGDVVVGRSLRMQVLLHNVPMTYVNAFTVGTEVEMKGHIAMKGQLIEFDVQWQDVCNVPQLKPNVWTDTEDHLPVRQPVAEPETPTGSSMYAFYNSPAASSSYASTPNSRRDASDDSRSLERDNNGDKRSSSISVGNVGSVNNNANVVAKPFGIAIPRRYEFAATLNHQFAFNDSLGVHSANAMLMDKTPPVPLRLQSPDIPQHILEMLRSGTRVVARGMVDLERRMLVMSVDSGDGILPEGYVIEPPVLEFSAAAQISGVDNKTHRIRAKIVEGFANVGGTNTYSGSVIVEDEEVVVITLTVLDVPDDKAPLLCKAATIEATGVISGDDFLMRMTCVWATDVVISSDFVEQRSSLRSLSPSASGTQHAARRKQSEVDKNVQASSDSEADEDAVQFLGSVDQDGQDLPISNIIARPIKQEDLQDDDLYSTAGQADGNAQATLQETPKLSSSSSIGGERKRASSLRQSSKKNRKLTDSDLS